MSVEVNLKFELSKINENLLLAEISEQEIRRIYDDKNYDHFKIEEIRAMKEFSTPRWDPASDSFFRCSDTAKRPKPVHNMKIDETEVEKTPTVKKEARTDKPTPEDYDVKIDLQVPEDSENLTYKLDDSKADKTLPPKSNVNSVKSADVEKKVK